MTTLAHELSNHRYVLCTPSAFRLLETTKRWLINGIQGTNVLGGFRFGKTYAAHYVSIKLAKSFGTPLNVFRVSIPSDQQRSSLTLFKEIMRGLGRGPFVSGGAREYRHRIVQELVDHAERTGEHRAVSIFDESLLLRKQDFEDLVSLWNDLETAGIKLFTISVGPEELQWRKNAFIKQGYGQYVGRFMLEDFRVRGLESKTELDFVFERYDVDTEFPVNSGKSMPQSCAPVAWGAGWRLKSLSDPVWRAFERAHREAGLPGDLAIPMQPIVAVAHRILLQAAENDRAGLTVGADLLDEFVAESGYCSLVACYTASVGAKQK